MEEDEGKLEKLLKWASGLGISDSDSCGSWCLGHSLVISNFPDAGGRGLGAARHLDKGELVLQVPKRPLITTESLLLNDHRLSLAVNFLSPPRSWSYGTYTNLELLEHYGFLLNENPDDKAYVPLEPEIYSSCSWPMMSLHIHQSGKPSFALLSALRLWETPVNRRRSVGHLAYSGLQLSLENEIHLPTTLLEDSLLLRVIDEIRHVNTPLEFANISSVLADEICTFKAKVLKGETDSEILVSRKTMQRSRERWRLAIQWRLGYKKILVDCISFCDEMIDVLYSQISQSQELRVAVLPFYQ